MPAASGPWQTAQRPANTAAPDTGSSAAAGSIAAAAASPTTSDAADAGTRGNVLLPVNRDIRDDGGGTGTRPALGAAAPMESVLLLVNRDTQDDGGGTGIRLALGAEAPGDFVVVLRAPDRPIALIVLAGTPAPGHTAAAVIV